MNMGVISKAEGIMFVKNCQLLGRSSTALGRGTKCGHSLKGFLFLLIPELRDSSGWGLQSKEVIRGCPGGRQDLHHGDQRLWHW